MIFTTKLVCANLAGPILQSTDAVVLKIPSWSNKGSHYCSICDAARAGEGKGAIEEHPPGKEAVEQDAAEPEVDLEDSETVQVITRKYTPVFVIEH